MNYKYECPSCESSHTGEEWDYHTSDQIGTSIEELHSISDPSNEDCFFMCPSCNNVSDKHEILIKHIPKTNEDALQLLEVD